MLGNSMLGLPSAAMPSGRRSSAVCNPVAAKYATRHAHRCAVRSTSSATASSPRCRPRCWTRRPIACRPCWWLGLHEKGGTVSGNLLIPLLPGRIGPKRFKAVVDGLLRSGNAFFVEKNGKVILMAENIRENASQLTRFKRAERARTGAKQIKRG